MGIDKKIARITKALGDAAKDVVHCDYKPFLFINLKSLMYRVNNGKISYADIAKRYG